MAMTINQTYINKNPDFQREYEAWDEKLITRFIETILIGRAMNPIWTILNPDDNSEEVLDGMHRLTTALDYLNNKFKLNSKYFTDESRVEIYDKKQFSELSLDDQHKIRNYNFTFNTLDSSYRTDSNKRRDQYEILNRSSRTLNDYEFNKVLYWKFFDLISTIKDEVNVLFFNKTDKRGDLQTEIIDIIVLSNELPKSWSSVNALRERYYKLTLGHTEESVNAYLQTKEENIKSTIRMIKKIITTLHDNQFFSKNKKTFNSWYLPYKVILGRLLYKFKDNVPLFNRHYGDILLQLKHQLINTDIDMQQKLGCKTRNAVFQQKLSDLIDTIIDSSFEKNKDKRLFSKIEINSKLKEQNNACANCKMTKEKYEGDHIMPWSTGGKTTIDNLQVLCIDCHDKKPVKN
jgi:hypothetical protein